MDEERLRVAVVDDEDSVRKALARLLRAAGIDAETFATGAEFLVAARARRPDCVVLDLHMPVMDGFAVQDDLVRSGIRVPVVIITGHDQPEYRDRAAGAGVSAYLSKPVDGNVLLEAIGMAVRR